MITGTTATSPSPTALPSSQLAATASKGVRFPLTRKIIFLIAAFVVPLTVVALFFLTEGPNKDIGVANLEIKGDAYLRPLAAILDQAPRFQSSKGVGKEAADASSKIDHAFDELDSAQTLYGKDLQFDSVALEKASRAGADPVSLRKLWKHLQDHPVEANSGVLYSQFLDGIGLAIAHAGDKSTLILDPDLDTYYLMDVTLNTLTANSRRLADLANAIIANGVTSADAKIQTAIFAAKLSDDLDSVKSHFVTIYAEDPNFNGVDPTLKPNTQPALQVYTDSMKKLLDALAKADTSNPQDLLGALSEARSANMDLWVKSVAELDVMLGQRIATYAGYRTQGLTYAAIILVIGSVAAALVLRSIAVPLFELTETIGKVARGDESARAVVSTRDEIGQLALAFNTMVTERSAARQTLEAENQQLQSNIQQLLLAVADASDGNLMVRAPVTEGALGNVADALNLMLGNVGELIKNAKSAARQVAQSASNINETTLEMTNGSTLQAKHLHGASEDATELTAQARAVSAACGDASKAAEQSAEAAKRGANIVREVIMDMDKVRESVQVNGKKIKRLGERSMEIGSILKTINEISAQTDMLALNASIEAGRAGEAGRGFSAVAEQVRALAERAKHATQQVEKLVGDIQQETAEAVTQSERQTEQVEVGAQKVAAAGVALGDIVKVSSESQTLVLQISASAEQQATRTGLMLQAVRSAADIAQLSEARVSGARTTSEQLASLAKKLDSQLAEFQVAGLN